MFVLKSAKESVLSGSVDFALDWGEICLLIFA